MRVVGYKAVKNKTSSSGILVKGDSTEGSLVQNRAKGSWVFHKSLDLGQDILANQVLQL